jgi:cytochrome P450
MSDGKKSIVSLLTGYGQILIKGFTGACLKNYVPLFEKEVKNFLRTCPIFNAETDICDISSVMAEITLYTAAGSLQGQEIRDKMDSEVALLYRHLDDGFAPINVGCFQCRLAKNRHSSWAHCFEALLILASAVHDALAPTSPEYSPRSCTAKNGSTIY